MNLFTSENIWKYKNCEWCCYWSKCSSWKSILEEDITVVGMPAKKVKNSGNPWKQLKIYFK